MKKTELDAWWERNLPRIHEIIREEKVGGTYGAYQRAALRIRDELGRAVSTDSLRRYAYQQRKLGGSLPSAPKPAHTHIDDVLDIPTRPFDVFYTVPTVSRSTSPWLTAVLYGDSHEPFCDSECMAVVLEVISDIQPDVVVHMGDLVDCYTISRFDKDPKRLLGMQDEIDAARAHLAELREVAPVSQIVLLEGNHEDRLRKVVYAMRGSERALATLRAFQQAMTWPKLLELDALGIQFLPLSEQSRQILLPKFLTTHGTRVSSRSGYTARVEHDRYGISGASGHTHRKATHYHKDHNGNHVWLETGCTCLLDQEYVVAPDWQQGLYIIHFNTTTGAFNIEDVYVHQGNAVWRGRAYCANGRDAQAAAGCR